jgi:uncharacterized membrane protein HdeD (DUF308 family)
MARKNKNDNENQNDQIKKNESGILPEILFDIVLLVLGIAFIVWPNNAAELLTRIVGIIILVLAIAEVIFFLKSKTRETWEIAGFVVAILFGLFGLWLVINPGWLVQFTNFIFGTIIAIYGLFGVISSLKFSRKAGGLWWLGLIMSITALALAILIFLNPTWISSFVMILIGATLIIAAVSGVLNSIKRNKAMGADRILPNTTVVMSSSDKMKDAGEDGQEK